ncbi:hypothetical protein E2562_004271 [Oryza meyeriana var. granulata]|uniref:Uncharacterized protein n=1 Tax=Oryza meyeriana var. granulata TaxID=110450 RepID=A0A6G1BQX9_9ORYZ|nr:hypothetical protein E2562_004271 [Oryza meyeriana var. granulata]
MVTEIDGTRRWRAFQQAIAETGHGWHRHGEETWGRRSSGSDWGTTKWRQREKEKGKGTTTMAMAVSR